MELVLGVSMAPTTIRMVLVEGENADGVMVEEDDLHVIAAHDSPTCRASDQVIAAILGTREGAAEAGSRLLSIGVTWTDQIEAAELRDALAARKIENVMLVSAFLAAAALAQTVGQSIGYQHTAMLFVEPETATLAVIDSADGSISDVHRRLVQGGDAVTELIGMVAGLELLPSRPEGVFVVGSGVDIAPIKSRLEAATPLAVSAPEEPETALARGAALASANAPLFASSTAALAYAQDPGTGAVDPYAVAPGYVGAPGVLPGTELGDKGLAYSAVPDEDADTLTVVLNNADNRFGQQRRRPFLLVSSALAVVFVTATLALEIALAVGIRPTVALRPNPAQSLIVPTAQPPAPAPAAQVPAPQPEAVTAPAVQPLPARVAVAPPPVNAPAPAAPPLPAAPPVPAPIPAAPPVPAPIPVAPPVPAPVPVAPVPVPVPIPVRVPAPAPVRVPPQQPPVQLPAPRPVQLPAPQPVQLPTQQPVHVPSPPVRAPSPPVQGLNPQPPGQLLSPQPVQVPSPPVRAPTPPVQGLDPQSPVHLPAVQPPANVIAPQPPVRLPALQPPAKLPAPEPPVNFPAPEPPVHMPAPAAPAFPVMPAPAAPAMPAMPAPQVPFMPAMPFPAAPVMPHFPVGVPHSRR